MDRYLELPHKHVSELKPVATPCLDDRQLHPLDDKVKKGFWKQTAKIVLRALYAAMFNHMDCLWSVN